MRTSFLLHIDSLLILEKMSNEQAGILLKAMYFYQLNGKLPELDFAIEMAITPFINQFKRDSEKYIQVVEKRKEAGSKGGKQKLANASKSKQNVAKLADSVSGNDSVSDSKKDNDFNPMDFLLSYGCEVDLIKDWFKVRAKKKGVNSEIAMQGFIREVEKSKININAVLRKCIEKSWVGFEADWIKGQVIGTITDNKVLWVKVRLGSTIQDFIKSNYEVALRENKLNCNNPEIIKEYYK